MPGPPDEAHAPRGPVDRGQLIEVDVLPLYKKYTDLFAIDDVPEAERTVVAERVADRVLERLASAIGGRATGS
jgi:hypothetical protein